MAITAVVICALFAYTFITKPEKYDRVITVAGKDFTEQQILVYLVSDMIENRTDIKVNRQPNLGGTQVCFAALKSGDVDLYIEYSGTAYGDTLRTPCRACCVNMVLTSNRSAVLAEYPELKPVLNELGSYLDEATMIKLNYRVDELQLQPPEVARKFRLLQLKYKHTYQDMIKSFYKIRYTNES